MKNSKRLATILIILCIAFPVLGKDYESGSTDKEEKELKRIAHRMRIPVEQLENARSALQEATDLAITLDPFPTSKINNIVSDWNTLQPSKAESVSEYFALELQLRALEAMDDKSYTQATSSGTTILSNLASINYHKAGEILSTWPYPLESFGEAAIKARYRMESNVTQSIMEQIAKEDPDALDEQSLNDYESSTGDLLSLANSLVRTGNRDKADELIDRAIQSVPQQGNDPILFLSAGNDPIFNYISSFAMAIRYMDNAQVGKLMDQLIPLMQKYPDNIPIPITMTKGDAELQLSRYELNFVNILRNLTSRPRLLNEILDKYPEFESKFDSFGGIDSYLSGGIYEPDYMKYQTELSIGSMPLSRNDSQILRDKLKYKAADNPDWVEQELRNAIEDPNDINVLTTLASNSARDCPELAEIALEIAEEFLPQIDDLQKRFSALQSVMSAYRNLDGEVDEELFQKGFTLIDQIQEERLLNSNETSPLLPRAQNSVFLPATDRLEANLIADLARQDYDKAIDHVHSMDPGIAKLDCLIQIARALRQNNF
jgi:tetratricopeptide (TPR) repeat protein